MPDAHRNFAVSAVATAPSPADSGTSLVVTASTGTNFPPAPFNATVWPADAQPTTTNAEIVRVTGVATDTLTLARTQEATSARAVAVGDLIAATVTAKTLTDVEQQAALGMPRGVIAQTCPRNVTMATVSPLATQRVHLCLIALPIGVTITTITFFSGTTALGSGNHQFFGIYDDDLGSTSGTPYALLRGSTDGTSAAWAADTAKALALDSTYTTTRAGYFYLGILVDATTVPTLRGVTAGNPAWLGGAPIVAGLSTTAQTSLPNPAIAPAPTVATGAVVPYGYVT